MLSLFLRTEHVELQSKSKLSTANNNKKFFVKMKMIAVAIR